MAIRNIVKIGDEVLRKKSKIVETIDNKIITLLEDMAETMHESKGVGLAAPQVGLLKRIIVIDVGEGLIELINPEIIDSEGSKKEDEACLSVPGKSGIVERPTYVKVTGLNRKGQKVQYEAHDFLAKAFCHEIDHLDGILYVDKAIEMDEEE